ncbi:MAG TPA: 6-phosphofructokinase [Candidatus Avilachnospira avicola]|nr:6-phosphofructokinase [Candidatus Avilachnospira avicola]
MQKYNILVGQSGGPTAVINCSLYGVIKESLDSDVIDKVYGMKNGIEGFLRGEIMDLGEFFSDPDKLELLKQTPSAFLGSCRYKLPPIDETEIYEEMFEKFEEYGIGAFLYIGGNDSMDTAGKLSAYAKRHGSHIRFLGVPKTIDNDLVGTDHTPGYGSAAKYIASTIRDISIDAGTYDIKSVTIVEIMGRHAGWLCAASALARNKHVHNPMLIYLPETPFHFERFVSDVKEALKKENNVVVCVSEGIRDSEHRLICEYSGKAEVDSFGHKKLTGAAKLLEEAVMNGIPGVKCRSIEFSLLQRSSSVLASGRDKEEAEQVGRFAVRSVIAGESHQMVCMERAEGDEYKIDYVLKDVAEIGNKEKMIPSWWITKNGTDVTDEFIDYVRPLIEGECDIRFSDGMPEYVYRD